jgi:sulfatase maturation enzyme AslB (radical SAM superfamily)
MSLARNFCASPWLHAHINNNGTYEVCRWAHKENRTSQHRIQTTHPVTWFQQGMSQFRQQLLAGEAPEACQHCHVMEQHNKVSGRQKQLLKAGISEPMFEQTLRSSPWFQTFQHSHDRQGHTDQLPQDWQIDLGNFCNSACLFCTPHASSRLATEQFRLGLIKRMPDPAWVDDETALQGFLDTLRSSPRLAYLHFIGGETLITPAFRRILTALIDSDLARTVTIGFTTNLTVWDQDIVDLLLQFHQVNLGVSVECLHPVNDYVRWPSRIPEVQAMLERWHQLANSAGWLMQMRVTPTVLSIWHLSTVYEWAMQHGVAVESCNFLYEPAFMRISVLPDDLRQQARARLQQWVSQHQVQGQQIINTRDPNQAPSQILQDAQSYIHYLANADSEHHRAPDLVRYLRVMQQSRGNDILDYLPEYEQFLRSAGL